MKKLLILISLIAAATLMMAAYPRIQVDNGKILVTGGKIQFAAAGGGLSSCDVLVVAGGGGGGSPSIGGGGGAGGYIYTNGVAVTGEVAVSVGAGGITAAYTSGSNSSFGAVEAIGGGAGSSYGVGSAQVGGSGGGGDPQMYLSGTNGTEGQGYAGGNGWASGSPSYVVGGGGGGAGGPGVTASGIGYPGNGGPGKTNDITGTAVGYAGGGGGAGYGYDGIWESGSATDGGGIGGTANNDQGYVQALPGQPNTGGGGGGAWGIYFDISPDGGSGIVVVRYQSATALASGGDSIITNGAYIIYKFTTVGTSAFTPRGMPPVTLTTATGGTITTNGGYIVHTFTNVGEDAFTVSGGSLVCDALVVAGGGGGGSSPYGIASGAGAGGVTTIVSLAISGTNIVIVGSGGFGGVGVVSLKGDDSVFGTITAYGGGKGTAYGVDASSGDGGSGGGGGFLSA